MTLELVIGLVGAGSTLIAVALTQRHATVMRKKDLRVMRHNEQRDVIVEVMAAGTGWVSSAEGIVMYMSRVADKVEITRSETFKDYGPVRERMARALIAARIVVTDSVLAPQVKNLSDGFDSWSEVVVRSVITSTRNNGGRCDTEVICNAKSCLTAYGVVLAHLEASTLERFAAELQAHPRWPAIIDDRLAVFDDRVARAHGTPSL